MWSVQPDASWQNAGLMLAYSAVFGAAVVLARAAPARWPAVLGGVTLAAVVVCGYALLTKVFPSWLDAHDIYARLQAPYGYWNATGLTAAMGVIGCLWLGARRRGHALLSALAYPAMGLLLVTLMLAYSRGALVALALGLALWFAVVPLRLRGAAVLLARRARRRARGRVGLLTERPQQRQRRAPRARDGRAPARRAAGRDAAAARARGARDRLLHRPARAFARAAAATPGRSC